MKIIIKNILSAVCLLITLQLSYYWMSTPGVQAGAAFLSGIFASIIFAIQNWDS